MNIEKSMKHNPSKCDEPNTMGSSLSTAAHSPKSGVSHGTPTSKYSKSSTTKK